MVKRLSDLIIITQLQYIEQSVLSPDLGLFQSAGLTENLDILLSQHWGSVLVAHPVEIVVGGLE